MRLNKLLCPDNNQLLRNFALIAINNYKFKKQNELTQISNENNIRSYTQSTYNCAIQDNQEIL
jgi:hypothetical protein